MRRRASTIVLAVALALGLGFMLASAALAAPSRQPLHRYQTGRPVRALQWLLGGHRPSRFKIVAYHGRRTGVYDRPTVKAVRNMKWRLGYPRSQITGNYAGQFLTDVLTGKRHRPTVYLVRVTRRLAYLKKIAAQRAKSDCARNVLRIARAELGVREVPYGSNRGARVSIYQAVTGAYGAPWCVSFAQWVLREARVRSPRAWHGAIANNSAGVFYVIGWAGQHGWLRSIPKPAFLVAFRDRLGHMGIVESTSSSGFTSIEGNASNMVLRRFHPFGARPEVFIAVPGCDTG